MKCESCRTNEIEIEIPKNDGLKGGIWDTGAETPPYRLCLSCCDRLKNMALRPLEFFNLTAIHGHSHYLHDDFYDYDTGEAMQPETDVIDPEKFPFPTFEEIRSDLGKLIDYSFVQYFTEDNIIRELQKFDKQKVLNEIDKKVRYNNSISYKAYEIVPYVVGRIAESWAKEQWINRCREESILTFAELLSGCMEKKEAFRLITSEIEKSADETLNSNISSLLYLRDEKTLDWIETVADKIKNVSSDWGQLAASSQFSWKRAEKWLNTGRPLSLIALDAIYLCTCKDYARQSIWLQKIKPQLVDQISPEKMAYKLREYLETDSVPRTKNAVGSIMYNLSETV